MRFGLFFLLVAAALTAPHLTWPEARAWSLVCVVFAAVFFVAEEWPR